MVEIPGSVPNHLVGTSYFADADFKLTHSNKSEQSEMDRPETIEESAALVDPAGGHGIAVQVDHLVPDAVRALVNRIENEQGRLDILVNNI
jgi:NAD(P)-dependent dehydrogenase (short-subunit alcohol dehydrogenase family)